MAEVDLIIFMRDQSYGKILVPERGARLGNSALQSSPEDSWVTVFRVDATGKVLKNMGSDGSVFFVVGRLNGTSQISDFFS